MLFRLALALGVSVRKVEKDISLKEVEEWRVFFESYPPLSEVVDSQLATLLFVVASALGGNDGKRVEEWSVYDSRRQKTKEEISRDIRRAFGLEG